MGEYIEFNLEGVEQGAHQFQVVIRSSDGQERAYDFQFEYLLDQILIDLMNSTETELDASISESTSQM